MYIYICIYNILKTHSMCAMEVTSSSRTRAPQLAKCGLSERGIVGWLGARQGRTLAGLLCLHSLRPGILTAWLLPGLVSLFPRLDPRNPGENSDWDITSGQARNVFQVPMR